MKRFLKMYTVEQKLSIRSFDSVIFGIIMPVGILILIAMIAGGKMAGDSGYTYLDSAFASLVTVGVCACAFMGLPLVVADYRDKKILKHFFVTPCSPLLILGADMLCFVVTSLISAAAVTLVSVFAFDFHMKGNLLVFVGVWFLTLIAMLSIGLLIASLCRTVKAVNAVSSIVYFPTLFLSGATIPYELFPEKLQKIANVLPLTQGIKLMKAISAGTPIDEVGYIVVLLIIITVVCTAVSVKTFRWE